MTDFRWFRILLFCMGLYFLATAVSESLYYVSWAIQQLPYLGGQYPNPGSILFAALVSIFPYVLKLAFGIYLIRGGGALTKWILRRIEHNCVRCDYGLREVTGTRCPECGLDFDRAKIDATKETAPSTT